MLRPFILAMSGGSASGKTTLARAVREQLGEETCEILFQDSYYRDLSEQFDRDGGNVNFDHPSSIDFELMADHLQALRDGLSINVPQYCFKTHQRMSETRPLHPKKVVLLDGILILSQPCIREQVDGAIFIDTDEDVRFDRRIQRDVAERGRTHQGVRDQFLAHVKPMHDMYVQPSKEFADMSFQGEGDLGPIVGKILKFLSRKNADFNFI
jgi:uridine kinase